MTDETTAPDVTGLTVREVRDRVGDIEDGDTLRQMLRDECEGDETRSTAVAAIEDRLDAVVPDEDTTPADDDSDTPESDADLQQVIVRNPAKTARVYANVGRLQPGETTTTTMAAARDHIQNNELQVVTSR